MPEGLSLATRIVYPADKRPIVYPDTSWGQSHIPRAMTRRVGRKKSISETEPKEPK
jgi:hypothetical protein